jgi:hypothetical protein
MSHSVDYHVVNAQLAALQQSENLDVQMAYDNLKVYVNLP